jgi:hypothetical protein
MLLSVNEQNRSRITSNATDLKIILIPFPCGHAPIKAYAEMKRR